jgi:hypothetical protein
MHKYRLGGTLCITLAGLKPTDVEQENPRRVQRARPKTVGRIKLRPTAGAVATGGLRQEARTGISRLCRYRLFDRIAGLGCGGGASLLFAFC